MKIKSALTGTVATIAAIGVIGTFGGEAETTDTDTPVTESYAVTETFDTAVTETELVVIETENIVTETTKIVTEAPKPVTEAPKPAHVLEIISVTSPVEAGTNATLKIKGNPGVEYDIDVIYKKTESKAQGLENKTASADGTVTWTWKVGSSTTPGTFTIYVVGGGETAEIKFTVYD